MTDASPSPLPSPLPLTIRAAGRADVPLILSLIRELAEYEHLSNACVVSESLLADHLFGAHPAAEVVLGFLADQPAAYALFFTSFSTFLGRPGIYLEDLFVRTHLRGRGVGKTMLAHVAAIACQRGCGRLEWSVLDWNQPAIQFYARLGGRPLSQWRMYRLAGAELDALAAHRRAAHGTDARREAISGQERQTPSGGV